MSKRLARLVQLLQMKQEATKKAYGEVMRITERINQTRTKHDQLVGYKQDYMAQIEVLGKEGCHFTQLNNRVNFIAHLDSALTQLNAQVTQLIKLRTQAELTYRQAKIAEEGMSKLVERVRKGEELKMERLAQKESDEFAQKKWYGAKNDEHK